MQLRRLTASLFVALVASLAVAAGAAAEPTWAPAGSASVRPGSMTFTDGAQCTSNFVFFDGANNVYIGQAAHCSGTDGSTATNGCESGSLPVGIKVDIEGASQPGTMVYNSWITMQQKNETNANACDYNDFALIKIASADTGKVNPTIPFWGGPDGIAGTTTSGESVYGYGNSSLRGGADELKPKQGRSLGQSGGGWNHQVYTFSPGIFGDSGSAFINSTGKAFGVLATVQIAPMAASNGVGDLSRELAYMWNNEPAFSDVTLAKGTEPFTGGMTAALGNGLR
jgi:hypothetical protein